MSRFFFFFLFSQCIQHPFAFTICTRSSCTLMQSARGEGVCIKVCPGIFTSRDLRKCGDYNPSVCSGIILQDSGTKLLEKNYVGFWEYNFRSPFLNSVGQRVFLWFAQTLTQSTPTLDIGRIADVQMRFSMIFHVRENRGIFSSFKEH